jgi:poly(hydroxyalkanoate) depolymerase family esterase
MDRISFAAALLRIAVAAWLLASAPASAGEARRESGFGANPGNLRMYAYRPPGLRAGAALVVVLHGCRQEAVPFARDAGWIALADRIGAALLLPEQVGLPPHLHDVPMLPMAARWMGANNQRACFNWFEPENTTRDRGEARSIRSMIDHMVARDRLDPERVFVAGLSAGGGMAAAMLAAYPELFAGGAVVAGIPAGCAALITEARPCMRGRDRSPAEWQRALRPPDRPDGRKPRVSIWHGLDDETVRPAAAVELVEQWTAYHGLSATLDLDAGGPGPRRQRHGEAGGVAPVESVLLPGFPHAFPIAADPSGRCGQASAYVRPAGICAAEEIARFWGIVP